MKKLWTAIKQWHFDHKTRPVWRVVINKYFILTVGLALWALFFNTNNVFHWAEARHTLREQKVLIKTLRQGIKETDAKIGRLKSQKDSLETFAREEYLYHEAGEEVYIIE